MPARFRSLQLSCGPLILAAALCSLGVTGCGESPEPTGKVAGTVTFNKKPIAEGTVNFIAKKKGVGASAPLDSEGKYVVTEPIPAGSYAVFILPPAMEPPLPGQPPNVPKEYPNIPMKYRTPETSKLKAVVGEGENPLDFDLKPE